MLTLYVKEKNQDYLEVFVLNGEGTYWRVNDYKVIRTNNELWRGSANLDYLGNELDGFYTFSYQFVEVNNEQPISVLVGSYGGESIISKFSSISKLGSLSGPLSSREKKLGRDELESSYVELTWIDHHGTELSDTIELNVTDHIKLN